MLMPKGRLQNQRRHNIAMACGYSNEQILTDDLKKTKELAVSLLKDKRSLLLSLQKERKAARKREAECKELRRQVGELEHSIAYRSDSTSTSLERLDVSPNDSLTTRHDCQAENATLVQKINTSERDIRKARAEIWELENHKVVLEAEVMRLAESLSKSTVSTLEEELLKEQLHVYEEDFKKEKGEKQAAEGRLITLEDTVKDCQDLISTLTREVDMYKSAYEREKREKELVLFHKASAGGLTGRLSHSQPEFPIGGSVVAPTPQLQVVYPVVDTTTKEQNLRRKQQLNRVGVFARNSNTTDGLFYSS